jgi:uncharacterized NAD-dependent epimerase/dehydratase family protein
LEACLAAARLTNKGVVGVGVSVNTARLDASERDAYLARVSAEMDLPAVDPIAVGVGPIVDRLASLGP